MRVNHAVVMGTYNRGHLLARSLQGYARQSIDTNELALVVLDDDSTDNTRQILKEFSFQHPAGPHIFYFHLSKPPGVAWRDSASFLNLGLSFAIHSLQAQYVWATHPEIIPGKDVLLAGEHHPLGHYMGCKGYYLTPAQQEAIDTVDWQSNICNVRQIPGFYDQHPDIKGPAQDYQHYNMDHHKTWESWIFGGFRRDLWLKFGGFNESNAWGTVDLDFVTRRRLLNIPTFTPQADQCMVIHQNHDDPAKNVPTPRDMEKAHAAVPDYRGINSARRPELLHPSRWLVNQSGL